MERRSKPPFRTGLARQTPSLPSDRTRRADLRRRGDDGELLRRAVGRACLPLRSAGGRLALGTGDPRTAPTRWGRAIVRDGKIYLASGNTNGHTGPVSAHFDAFDPATGTWTVLPDVPNPRDHFFATYVEDQDKLYLVGGRTSGDPDTFLGTVPEVDVYDFASGSWSTLPAAKNLPTERASAPTGLVGNEIIVAGGEREQGPAKDVTEAFNVNTETWRTLAPMQTQRHATQAIVSNAGLYVAAGSPKRGGPGGATPDLEAFYLFGETSPTGSALSASTLDVPASIDFGQVAPGGSAVETVALGGSGGSQAIVIEAAILSGSADFALAQPFSGPLVIAPGAPLDLDVTFAPADEGIETGVLTVTYGGGTTADIALSGEGNSQGGGPAVALFRVNAGGPQVATTDSGPDWMADTDASAFRTNGSRTAGHGLPNATDASVPPGTPTSLFETERWDPPQAPEMQWSFPVDDGAYLVRLYLMDGFQGTDEAGQRIFDITVEGATAANDLDLAGQYGHKTAVALEFATTVSDGSLTIGFVHATQNPLVNAIEILSRSEGGSTNQPPQVAAIEDQAGAEGDDVADVGLAVQASDPDGGPQSLHYSATGLPEGVELEPTNGQFFGTIASGAAAGSPYGVTVTVSDGAASADVSFMWTVTGFTTLGQALYRVNMGGPPLAAADGSQPGWSRDQGNAENKSPYLVEGGTKNKRTSDAITLDASVAASAPMTLFQTERWDPSKGAEMRWAFPVAAGTQVEIRLYLAETFLTETGTNSNASKGPRVMDVAVDGAVPPVFSDLDVFADVGHDVGTMRSFTTTSDGSIDIAFLRIQQNPSIKGIEILEAGGTAGNASSNGGAGGQTSGSDVAATGGSAGQASYLPEAFKLRGNYPNPFNPSTEISLDVPEHAQVRVEVYNMLGQRVLVVPEQDVAPGTGQTLRIEAASLVSGVYLYRVVARMGTQEAVDVGRMTLLK
ncbi:MAG: malectin domain-containing carbohydrate-binding protein [Rhodothermales bacterium]